MGKAGKGNRFRHGVTLNADLSSFRGGASGRPGFNKSVLSKRLLNSWAEEVSEEDGFYLGRVDFCIALSEAYAAVESLLDDWLFLARVETLPATEQMAMCRKRVKDRVKRFLTVRFRARCQGVEEEIDQAKLEEGRESNLHRLVRWEPCLPDARAEPRELSPKQGPERSVTAVKSIFAALLQARASGGGGAGATSSSSSSSSSSSPPASSPGVSRSSSSSSSSLVCPSSPHSSVRFNASDSDQDR